MSLMKNVKVLNKTVANEIQQHIKETYTTTKWYFLLNTNKNQFT